MYQVSDSYKSKIYEPSVKHLLRIYINDVEIDKKYILDCKISQQLFSNDEFTLGSVTAKSIELKLYKTAVPENINKIYITSGISEEEIPIGYFNVDEINREDDYTVQLKLLDNMIKFEFNYDGSQLNYPCTILEVLQDICLKAGVELASTSFLNSDKLVAVYDNTISARTYLSYVSEQAGGFAYIDRDGKLFIKSIGDDIVELPLKYFQNFKWGEKFKISRVKYEDGIQLFESGSNENNTLYISQDNMYIVEQEQIDNIYEKIKDLEVYSFEGESIIDIALDVGDILLIDNKKIIYQGSLQYAGKWKTSISSKIQCKSKEETTTRVTSQKTINRRVQSQIDQAEGEITQLIEEQSGIEEKIAQQTITVNGIRNEVSSTNAKVEELEENKVDNSNYNQMIETLKTMIEQGDSQIEFNFKNIQDKTDELGNIIAENQSVLEEYIRFKGALIELGRVGNDFTAELSNTELAFKQNGQKIAYISNNKLYITDAEVQNKLVIGKFAFIPRANQNLSFTWIGG